MKAVDFIRVVRDDLNELYNLHQLAEATNDAQGFRCLKPERLMAKMRCTDKEIVEFYLAQGAQIEDAEEYLAGLQ